MSKSQDDAFFIDPTATARLQLALPGDHWIEVKRELSFAEDQALKASMYRALRGATEGGREEAQVVVDVKRHAIETFVTWIVDWSLTRAGKRVEVSRSAIEVLRAPVADAIATALGEHIEAVESEKKGPSATAS